VPRALFVSCLRTLAALLGHKNEPGDLNVRPRVELYTKVPERTADNREPLVAFLKTRVLLALAVAHFSPISATPSARLQTVVDLDPGLRQFAALPYSMHIPQAAGSQLF